MLMRRSWSVANGSEMDSSDENSSSLSNTQTSYKNMTEKWVCKPFKEKQPSNYSSYSSDDDQHDDNQDVETKRLTYCYLCSIGAHVHKKTEPVPVHKRRYLKPYMNPFELERRLERQYRQIVPKIRYRFLIQTGSERNGGTEAPVFFKLYGSAGVWEATQLRAAASTSRPDAITRFVAGTQEEIMLDGPIIGDLRKLKIWHNGKSLKDDWYLDFIEITCYKLNQTWRFICDQWISKKAETNPITLSLGNNSALDSEKANNLTEYVIMIKTSSKPLVGRDVNVQFQFVCAKGQTQVFNLLTQHVNLFEPLQLDCFLVRSSHDLGKPEKLRMAHNGKRTHEWSIESIRVYYSKDPNNFYAFKIDKWLEKNEKMNAIISMQSVVPVASGEKHLGESEKMIYHISVMTGNVRFGGTDAKVFVQFKGSKGVSDVHRLHNPRTKKEFERGQIDHFHIFDKNVGELKLVKIWHDNSGSAPGWFLQAVLIKAIPTTLSGQVGKHDVELRDQLDRLIKKYRIKELNLEDALRRGRQPSKKSSSSSTKRSKSADSSPSHSNAPSPTPSTTTTNNKSSRSSSVEPTESKSSRKSSASSLASSSVSLKNVLKKNHAKASQLSRSSPTLSILKTSASPRTVRKSVKFDAKTIKESGQASAPPSSSSSKVSKADGGGKQAPRIDMNLEWLMSIAYAENGPIRSIRTIENFDNNIKNIDNSLVEAYNAKMKKLEKTKTQQSTREESGKSPDLGGSKVKPENAIYVFECNKWLSKDADDRKIERVIKLSNILASK